MEASKYQPGSSPNDETLLFFSNEGNKDLFKQRNVLLEEDKS